jgi:hypothetical protein
MIFAFAGGCGYSSGFVRDSRSAQLIKYDSRATLVSYSRSVDGQATNSSLFCVIPLSSDPLYKSAMEELHKAAKLKPNEALMNLREDRLRITYFGFYCKVLLTLSADVMTLRQHRTAYFGRHRSSAPTTHRSRTAPAPKAATPASKPSGPVPQAVDSE